MNSPLPTTPSSAALYRRLLGYLRPYWKVFLLATLGMAAAGLTEPMLPALLKPMFDRGFGPNSSANFHIIPLLLIALFTVRGLITFASSYCMSWVSNRILLDIREEMYAKLIRLPTGYYDHQTTGALISRVTHDVGNVTAAATSVLTTLVRESVTVVGLVGYLLWLNWKLTLLALVIIPPVGFIVRKLSLRLRAMSREAQIAMGDLTHVLEETIGAHKVIKVYGGQAYEAERFFKASNRLRGYNMKQSLAASASTPVTHIFFAFAMALVIYVALLQSSQQQLTAGGFAAFTFAMLLVLNPIKHLVDINSPLQRGLAAAESVFSMIDEVPEDDQGTKELSRASGRMVFSDVSFRYRGAARDALRQVSITIEPGTSVALVGPSGGGKTTFANLIPRFYHPGNGTISLDGHNLEDLKLVSLRAQIALVSQDVVLFNDTVAANIAYGLQRASTEDEIWAAVRAAHAEDFIRQMPQGLQTMIGENGVRLSGGQRQRLAIARAILKNAPILILDEATSALDSESERQVQAALDGLMQGRTTIVIAHRLSTIERADKIVALQGGRLAEQGTHAELLAANGVYASLYRLQFGEQTVSESAA